MSKLTGKELAKVFGDSLNNYNFDVDEFVQELSKEHRTIQQSVFGAIMAVVSNVASPDYRTDGRNEQSHKVAKQLLKGYEEELYKEYISQGDSEERAREHSKFAATRLSSMSFI